MASNHVQPQIPPDQSGNMFSDGGGHEAFGYNNPIYPHGQSYGTNWVVDPSLQDRSQNNFQAAPISSSVYHPQAWHPHQNATATQTPASTSGPQQNTYNAPRNYYSLPPSTSSSTPFQSTSPYAGHGFQYHNSLDPSLVSRPPTTDNRTFGQSLPAYSSASPSNTISPSALFAGIPRQGQSPASQHQLPQSTRPSYINSATFSQPPKAPMAPKGRLDSFGKFIVTDFEKLANTTQSVRLHNFINVGSIQQEIPIAKSTIPQYAARKSQNELKVMAAKDPLLQAKIKKRVKESKIIVPRPGHTKGVNGASHSPGLPSSASDSSDYDSDSSDESDLDIEELSPLPASRPQAPVEAVRYDTIRAVWLPRNKFNSDDAIRNGVKDFWEVIKTIRDRWRKDSDDVIAATEAKKEGELPLLKERVDKQREMLQVALNTAIEHGHPDVLRAYTHKTILFAPYQFLVERVKAEDYNGALTKTILKFLSLCAGVTNEILETVKLDKVLSRFLKRSDDEGKALAKMIVDNAAAESKKKAEVGSPKSIEAAKAGKPDDRKDKVIKKEPQPVTAVKQSKTSDGTVKRPNSVAPTTTAASKGGLLKRPASANSTGSAATTAGAAKPKGHQVVSKAPVSFFAGLQSASKKPGTASSAAKPKVATGTQEKKATTPAAPINKPSFSFAETMATLTREKEPESSKPEVKKGPPETAEAKAKRLKKEQRRKLRVSWKPDTTLVEVKLFSRDPSEMPGNATNVRDVHGGKEKEGLMFKQHMEMMDVDEDDDQPMEQTFFDFRAPTAINFSTMDPESVTMNYEPYGGGIKKVDSDERRVQENREASTLMVHYMVKSDIPPCPKEPIDPYTGEHMETIKFGAPDNPKLLARLAKFAPPLVAVPDVSAILASLKMLPPQAPQQPQDPNAILQSLLAQTSNNNQFPHVALQSTAPQHPAASATPAGLDELLATLSKTNQQPAQQVQQPQASLPPAFTFPPQLGGAPVDQNAAALYAALLATQGQAQAAPYPTYSAPQEPYEQPNSRKRDYREADGNTYPADSDQKKKRQKWNNGGQGGKKFVLPCRFWKQGKCQKGADCTYLHE